MSYTRAVTSFRPAQILAALRTARPASNIKNIGIILFAYYLAETPGALRDILLPLFALSFVTSTMYTLNAWTDVEIDEQNPGKRSRAAAARSILPLLPVLAALLCIVGLALGFFLNIRVVGFLVLLGASAVVYSAPPFRLKEHAGWDVFFGSITFPLRFLTAWYAFSSLFPPLLPLVGLFACKAGLFTLYKVMDRPTFIAAGIRNTTTRLSAQQNIIVGSMLTSIGILAFIGMLFTEHLGLSSLGSLPPRILIVIPLGLPLIGMLFLRARGFTRAPVSVLRALGLLYGLVVTFIAWLWLTV